MSPTKGGPVNVQGLLGVGLTLVFGLFVATFVWYVLAGFAHWAFTADRPLATRPDGSLMATLFCIGWWFPLRIYATWYANYFVDKHWLRSHTAVFTLVVIYMVLLGAIGFQMVAGSLPGWLELAGVAVAPFIVFLLKLKPELIVALAKQIEVLHPVQIITIELVVGVVVSVGGVAMLST